MAEAPPAAIPRLLQQWREQADKLDERRREAETRDMYAAMSFCREAKWLRERADEVEDALRRVAPEAQAETYPLVDVETGIRYREVRRWLADDGATWIDLAYHAGEHREPITHHRSVRADLFEKLFTVAAPAVETSLRAYVQHKGTCAKWSEPWEWPRHLNHGKSCTCGLDAALLAAGGSTETK